MRPLLLLILVACDVGSGAQPDPPLLQVTSPQRSAVQATAGTVIVTGRVAPNPTGAAVARVTVNDVVATIGADGAFSATLAVPVGMTLIHTVATDAEGGIATDTRSLLAGERRAPGAFVEGAVAAAISPPAFAKLAALATNLVKTANLTAVVGAMNPVAHAGDDQGPDCLYAQAFVDSVTIGDAKITLAPVAGGLAITARLDNPRIVGRTQHAVACADGASNFVITANAASFTGVLTLAANGTGGFTTELVAPMIALPGLDIRATNFPDALLDVLPLEKVIQAVAPLAVKMFVNPLLQDAFGALTEPQRLAVLGKNLTIQVAPRNVTFTPDAATVALDMKLLFDGAQNAPGYTFTPNGAPALAPGNGVALGIADDLANDALAQLAATGLLNLNLVREGSTFTTAKITPTTAPVVSADGADGKLRVILPDMMVTFLDPAGTPVARAAVNAQIPFSVEPTADGAAIAIDLGAPAIAIDDLDDLTGMTMPPESEFARTITLSTDTQKGTIAETLERIPLPSFAGIRLRDLSIKGANGYVTVKTGIE